MKNINNKGSTLIEVMISLVCLSILFLMIMTFISGQNRFSFNLSNNNSKYNQLVSDIEVNDTSSVNNIESVDIDIKIGVKNFEYTLDELEYTDEDDMFKLYNLQIR